MTPVFFFFFFFDLFDHNQSWIILMVGLPRFNVYTMGSSYHHYFRRYLSLLKHRHAPTRRCSKLLPRVWILRLLASYARHAAGSPSPVNFETSGSFAIPRPPITVFLRAHALSHVQLTRPGFRPSTAPITVVSRASALTRLLYRLRNRSSAPCFSIYVDHIRRALPSSCSSATTTGASSCSCSPTTYSSLLPSPPKPSRAR